MEKIKLLALFGKSSAGKDSIQHWLGYKFNDIHEIISYTSRSPRDYEMDGREYHFISREAFKDLIYEEKMLEYSYFNTWYYGTCINELNKNKINVGIFNPEGIRNLLKYSKSLDILPVWIQANDKTRLLRSLNREKNPNCEEICRRFLSDEKDFSHIDFNYEEYLNDKNNGEYYGFLNRPKIADFIKDKID